MKQVLIIEAQIKKYRLPFYQQLLEALRNVDIELRVGYSNPPPAEAAGALPPAESGLQLAANNNTHS